MKPRLPDGTFPEGIRIKYSRTALQAAYSIPEGVVNEKSHALGMSTGEPIIVILDCLLQYATAYRKRFGDRLADDRILGDGWLAAARGVKVLLDGDGAVAMHLNRSTDSKDNGACDQMYAEAMATAGFTYEGDIAPK